MSQARHASEAAHALETSENLLLLTDEGMNILSRFARSLGCDFSMMREYEKEHPGHIAEWIEKERKSLFCFLVAIKFTFEI